MINTESVIGDRCVIDAFYDTNKGRRLGIIVCAGANRNAGTGGALAFLVRRGLHTVAKSHWGVSSGIATMGYFAGKGKMSDVRVFSKDTNDARLLNPLRFCVGKPVLDIDYLDRVFRGVETGRPINAKRVIDNGVPFFAVLADPYSGTPLIYKASTPEEVYQLAAAGSAIPGISRPAWFRGREVGDGGFTTEHLPINALMNQPEPPTDILVFTARHYSDEPQKIRLVEELMLRVGLRHITRPARELIRSRHRRFIDSAKKALERPDVKVLTVWNSEKLPSFHIPERSSRALALSGFLTMQTLFKERGY